MKSEPSGFSYEPIHQVSFVSLNEWRKVIYILFYIKGQYNYEYTLHNN